MTQLVRNAYRFAVTLLCTILIAVAAILVGAAFALADEPPLSGTIVEIITNPATGAHGSGVHVGGGMIVTAAHVVGDLPRVTIRTDAAEQPDLEARVVIYDRLTDLAVVRVESAEGIGETDIDCEPVTVGAEVRAIGYPMSIGYVVTWGRIAGAPRAFGRWASVFPIDITVIDGMSGGAVLNAEGAVVAVTLGLVWPNGVPSTMTMAVPSAEVCRLLRR